MEGGGGGEGEEDGKLHTEALDGNNLGFVAIKR